MSTEFGEYQKTESPNKNQLNSPNNNLNDHFFDNYKLSNTKAAEDSNLSPNKEALLETNPTITSKDNIAGSQKIFPQETAETQYIAASGIQPESSKVENAIPNESLNPSQSKIGVNSSLGNAEANNLDVKKSLYESNPEPIENYIIPKPTDSFEGQSEVKLFNEQQNNNQNEEKQGKSGVFLNDDEINKMENQFSALKISKTRYLSEEELAKINNENNENDNNQNPTNSNAQINQNENINNANLANTNVSNTNNEGGEEKKMDTNIGSNEFIKMSKSQYDKDNNNELNQEPSPQKKIISNAHNIKVLKIEDEENIQLCPDFISGFLNKLFG